MFYYIWTLLYRCYRSYIRAFHPQIENDRFHVPSHKLPWLWIGAKYDEDDRTMTATHLVNESVTWGDCVDSQFLDYCTSMGPDRWVYLDTKTLEEKEFPSEGLLIEDDSVKQPVESDSETETESESESD